MIYIFLCFSRCEGVRLGSPVTMVVWVLHSSTMSWFGGILGKFGEEVSSRWTDGIRKCLTPRGIRWKLFILWQFFEAFFCLDVQEINLRCIQAAQRRIEWCMKMRDGEQQALCSALKSCWLPWLRDRNLALCEAAGRTRGSASSLLKCLIDECY